MAGLSSSSLEVGREYGVVFILKSWII